MCPSRHSLGPFLTVMTENPLVFPLSDNAMLKLSIYWSKPALAFVMLHHCPWPQ